MERHGHVDLDPVIKTKVLQVSAATVDRVLVAARAHIDGQRKRRKGVGARGRQTVAASRYAPAKPGWQRCAPSCSSQATAMSMHCTSSSKPWVSR